MLLKVTLIPVLTLILTYTLSVFGTFLPPESSHMGASIFIFLHFILWAILVNLIPVPRSSDAIESISLRRSTTWLVVGFVVFLFFVFILGPGLGPLGEDPRLR